MPDFFGFENWQEVIEFTKSGEGAYLVTFVNLVESRGERQLMWALNRTVTEENSGLIISTAHKAKGREWPTVRLTDDFLRSRPRKSAEGEPEPTLDLAELRLLYVAMTRGKEAVEIPESLLELIGLRERRKEETVPPKPVEQPVNQVRPTNSFFSATAPRRDQREFAAYAVSSVSPKNWRPPEPPTAPSVREHSRPSAARAPQKAKGVLDWLFGR